MTFNKILILILKTNNMQEIFNEKIFKPTRKNSTSHFIPNSSQNLTLFA